MRRDLVFLVRGDLDRGDLDRGDLDRLRLVDFCIRDLGIFFVYNFI